MTKPTPKNIQDRIIELYESGLSISAIYKQISVSKPTITKILKNNNIPITKSNYKSLDIDWDAINQEYNNGASTYELSKKYGCSDETIRKRIKNIRNASDRNSRNNESIAKISDSCKKLWQDEDYIENQKIGHQKYLDSGLAAEHAKQNYSKSLGKWMQSDEAKPTLSERAKKQWQNPELQKKFLRTIKDEKNVKSRIIGTRQFAKQSLPYRKKEFIKRARLVHGSKYDYSDVGFTGTMEHVVIICPIHGKFSQRPNHHTSLKNGCPSCPTIISSPHQSIINVIPSNIQHVNNNRNILNGQEIDIYFPDHKFGIEIHGAYWHSCKSSNKLKHSHYKTLHQLKANLAAEKGISLYQFWDFEINNNQELIKSMIYNQLGLSKKVYARKCKLEKVNNSTTKSFFDSSHLQGHRSSRETYALILNDEIQCCASFSNHPKYGWEIMRYACKLHTTVIGGFSRLFKAFIKEHDPDVILTFADKRISTGNLYLRNNFKKLEDTSPNYCYYKNNVVLSRQRCQKNKLSKLLGDEFNPGLSEFSNMLNNGFGRIYDAGNVKMLWFK